MYVCINPANICMLCWILLLVQFLAISWFISFVSFEYMLECWKWPFKCADRLHVYMSQFDCRCQNEQGAGCGVLAALNGPHQV